MSISMTMKVTNLIGKCPVCGDDKIGNCSKFIIDDETFERTCRKCGWSITGKIEDNKVIVESDNRDKLIKS